MERGVHEVQPKERHTDRDGDAEANAAGGRGYDVHEAEALRGPGIASSSRGNF
jgi:hypothetical protein